LPAKQAIMMNSSGTFGPEFADEDTECPVCASPFEEERNALLDASPLGKSAARPTPAHDDELDAI
jgi:hypothetical protein